MYCEKCNKYYSKNDKYCNICGNELIEKEQSKEEKKGNKKKSKKNTALIIILIILGVSLIIGSTAFAFKSMIKYGDKLRALDYVELGDDKIPTMHLVNNNITATGYFKNISKVEIQYNQNLYDYNIIDEYISFMEDSGFTYVEKSSTNWYLVSESVDDNKVLLVNIYENTDTDGNLYFTVTYEKKFDIFDKYVEKVNYMQVGKEKYGYISIPDNWNLYSEDKRIVYYNGNNTLVLDYRDLNEEENVTIESIYSSMYQDLYSENDEELKSIKVKVNDYDAYQISGYSDEAYYVIWLFEDENKIVHYVEFDSDRKNNDIFKLIETFKLEKNK